MVSLRNICINTLHKGDNNDDDDDDDDNNINNNKLKISLTSIPDSLSILNTPCGFFQITVKL